MPNKVKQTLGSPPRAVHRAAARINEPEALCPIRTWLDRKGGRGEIVLDDDACRSHADRSKYAPGGVKGSLCLHAPHGHFSPSAGASVLGRY